MTSIPSHLTPDFTVIGAGVFGYSTAIELRKRGYSVQLINAGPDLDPAASSYDISKIVRMEYGRDTFYMDTVDRCIDTWQLWNAEARTKLYYETGFLLLCSSSMDAPEQIYEMASFQNLIARQKSPERLGVDDINDRYPAFVRGRFVDGFYHQRAGFADAYETLRYLRDTAERLGVDIQTQTRILKLNTKGARVVSAATAHGDSIPVGEVVLTVGAFTRQLLPEYSDVLVSTGHPVYHITPETDTLFTPEKFPVFAADISNTGWYGFPMHPRTGVVKLANHGPGLIQDAPYKSDDIDPIADRRFADFLSATFPTLQSTDVSYRRYCYYCDTFDGHFWIDRHQEISNLTVAAGGSGHGFKMAPILGTWISDCAEEKPQLVPTRFRHRTPSGGEKSIEDARYCGD